MRLNVTTNNSLVYDQIITLIKNIFIDVHVPMVLLVSHCMVKCLQFQVT